MQVFALYLRSRGPLSSAEPDRARGSDLQGVLLYGATTITYFANLFTGDRTTVVDAVGKSWRTGDIYETSSSSTCDGPGRAGSDAVAAARWTIGTPVVPRFRPARDENHRRTTYSIAGTSSLAPSPIRSLLRRPEWVTNTTATVKGTLCDRSYEPYWLLVAAASRIEERRLAIFGDAPSSSCLK
jgi:hypothetical protein